MLIDENKAVVETINVCKQIWYNKIYRFCLCKEKLVDHFMQTFERIIFINFKIESDSLF